MAEPLPSIDRRSLLASAAALTAAGAVPGADRPTTASREALPPAPNVQTTNVSAATARRFIEIGRRNEIRREAGLPPLKVAAEWRRIKEVEDRQAREEAFERFAAIHEKEIWDQVLKQRREKEQNPDWRPVTLAEGVDCQRQVRKILRDQFAGCLKRKRPSLKVLASARLLL
jgi:hypothetical protein